MIWIIIMILFILGYFLYKDKMDNCSIPIKLGILGIVIMILGNFLGTQSIRWFIVPLIGKVIIVLCVSVILYQLVLRNRGISVKVLSFGFLLNMCIRWIQDDLVWTYGAVNLVISVTSISYIIILLGGLLIVGAWIFKNRNN